MPKRHSSTRGGNSKKLRHARASISDGTRDEYCAALPTYSERRAVTDGHAYASVPAAAPQPHVTSPFRAAYSPTATRATAVSNVIYQDQLEAVPPDDVPPREVGAVTAHVPEAALGYQTAGFVAEDTNPDEIHRASITAEQGSAHPSRLNSSDTTAFLGLQAGGPFQLSTLILSGVPEPTYQELQDQRLNEHRTGGASQTTGYFTPLSIPLDTTRDSDRARVIRRVEVVVSGALTPPPDGVAAYPLSLDYAPDEAEEGALGGQASNFDHPHWNGYPHEHDHPSH